MTDFAIKHDYHHEGLPRWLSWQRTCQCSRPRRRGFDAWIRKISWRRKWQPTLVFLPGKSHGQRSLAGCGPWFPKERAITESARCESDSSWTHFLHRHGIVYSAVCSLVECSSIIIPPQISTFSYKVYCFYSCEGEETFNKLSLNSAKLNWLAQDYIAIYERRHRVPTSKGLPWWPSG